MDGDLRRPHRLMLNKPQPLQIPVGRCSAVSVSFPSTHPRAHQHMLLVIKHLEIKISAAALFRALISITPLLLFIPHYLTPPVHHRVGMSSSISAALLQKICETLPMSPKQGIMYRHFC